jgi:signal transduction histidine kinase
MRYFLLHLLFTVITLTTKPDEIDSLINILPLTTDKYDKATILNDLCLKLVYSDPDSSLVFGKMALAIGKSSNDDLIKGKSFNRIGIVYDVKNIWDSALIYYDSALYFSIRAADSVTIASAYNNIGLVYWNKSLYDKAIDNFFNSLKLFEKLGKKKGVANTYNNIGLILMEQGRDSAALFYQTSGLRIREEIGDENGINDSRLNIALLYWSTKQYDSSALNYRRVIPFYLQTNNHYALGTAYHGLAQVFEVKREWDSALFYFDKAVVNHLEVGNNYKAASSLLNKSFIYNEMGDRNNELKILLRAGELVKDKSTERVRSKILFQLALLYHDLGHYKKSSEIFLEFKTIRDSMYDVDRDEKIEQIKVQYETEKKEKALLEQKAENERLEKEKALAEVRVNNRNIWIITISGAGLIVILLMLYLSQRTKRKVQAEKDAAIIQERENGMKAIFDAQEEERKRIAKDLHDGLGQQISAIKLFFQGLTRGITDLNPELKTGINKINNMITDAGTDVRTISHQMMPRALTELGLAEALEDMIDKSFSNSGILCKFEQYKMEERLPQHIEIGLYRIAQELLNNIIKHSGAVKVEVQLMRIESHCILIVQDDGRGISSNQNSEGIGMMNISNRLRTINGELNVESGSDHGTTATIRIVLE